MQKLIIGITGSTGGLGKQLLKYKDKVKFICFKNDIRSKRKVVQWFKKNRFDAIFHLAAIVPTNIVNKNKKVALDVNYKATKNIVDEVIKYNINWFFFSSTSHVYFSSKKKISENFLIKPVSFYGLTKKLAEDYIIKKLNKTKLNYCIGRIFSISNKNHKKNFLVPELKKKISHRKNTIILKDLNHYRDFISTRDLSKIIMHLYKMRFKGVINLGTGKAIHLKNIAKILAKKYGANIKFEDNKNPTHLIANIKKLKKIYKYNLLKKIEDRVF